MTRYITSFLRQKLAGLLILASLVACQSTRTINSTDHPPDLLGAPNLTRDEAIRRYDQVKTITYRLFLDLTQPNSFSGREEINFDWRGSPQGLRLDFFQGEITSLKMNGAPVHYTYNRQFIMIARNDLKVGHNQIEIEYSHPYTDIGGLARFVDPEDKRVYLHSKFEPYRANQMFPCFDQPDLKATYALEVKAPADWVVVAPTLEEKKQPDEGNTTRWTFPESLPFSTYLFSVHAGPYKIWSDTTGDIPLRLLARQSLAKYVEAKDWLRWTKAGLAFYNTYTNFPYPFKKYDQIVAPAFTSGAMENVAAVTFSERFVTRGRKLREDKRSLANVILHEMAHMWFGDLVTMKWWNDLWLNESFATFAANLTSVEATEFKEAIAVANGSKSSTLWLDQLVTTHPIESHIADIKDAQTSFDGITYGKGAAVLQQLQYYLGPESFKKGLQEYFKNYAWKNTERKDFIQSLASASDRDLTLWQEKWLTTANVNSIQIESECRSGKITKLNVVQSADPAFPTLRPQAFEVAFLNEKSGTLTVVDHFRVEIADRAVTQLTDRIGLACPQVIFPNYNGVGYFRTVLDAGSAQKLLKGASKIQDENLQIMVWSALWQSVQAAHLSFIRFGDAVVDALEKEKRSDLLEVHLTRLSNIYTFYFDGDLQNRNSFKTFVRRTEACLWSRFLHSDPATKKLWFETLVATAQSPERLKLLARIYDGQTKTPNFPVDVDLRWSILRKLANHDYKEVRRLIEQGRQLDPSFSGKIGAMTSEAALPDWSEKVKWIEEFKKDKSDYTYVELRSVFHSLFPASQKGLRKKYQDQFYPDLLVITGHKDNLAQATFASLAPYVCEGNSLAVADAFIKNHAGLDPSVIKALRESADASVRCSKIVQAAEN